MAENHLIHYVIQLQDTLRIHISHSAETLGVEIPSPLSINHLPA
jgi:hypothetical protein